MNCKPANTSFSPSVHASTSLSIRLGEDFINQQSTAFDTRFKFTGKEKDSETGYSYFGARYYDSDISVWLSVDPMASKFPGISGYAYCNNNPLNFIDKFGMSPDEPPGTNSDTQSEQNPADVPKGANPDLYSSTPTQEYYGNGKVIPPASEGSSSTPTTPATQNNSNIKIKFATSANRSTVSNYTMDVITDLLIKSGNNSAIITSTTRTPSDQARIMYGNIRSQGVAKQKALYGPSGDRVIDFYPDQNAMLQEILSIGPSKVSAHCADPSKLNVLDISPNSIRYGPAFINAILNDPRVGKFLGPSDNDPAYHIEIPQPQP